jgi:predicted dehydrogenase
LGALASGGTPRSPRPHPKEATVRTSSVFGRRTLLRGSAGAAALSALSYRRVLGANDRIRLGVVGTGNRAQSLMRKLKEIPGTEQIAICDVYEPRLDEAAAIVGPQAQRNRDHREVLDRKDIDAVVIGSPQHWHRAMTLDALKADKDIFLEKSVSHTIEEGVEMVKAVEASKRVVQTGTQQRSYPHYIQGAEMVAAGKVGQINYIHAYWYQNITKRQYPEWKPDKLDWKRFTGRARLLPVTWDHYYKWRWFWNFGGGPICELLTHWIDVVHWYTGATAPRLVFARGAHTFSKYELPDTVTAMLEYPTFTVAFTNHMASKIGDGGVEFRGTKGTLRVDRSHLAFYAEESTNEPGTLLPKPDAVVRSPKDGTLHHLENFIECMRSRKTPTAPMRVAHAASRASHLCNMSLRSGKPVRWNDERQKIERA